MVGMVKNKSACVGWSAKLKCLLGVKLSLRKVDFSGKIFWQMVRTGGYAPFFHVGVGDKEIPQVCTTN